MYIIIVNISSDHRTGAKCSSCRVEYLHCGILGYNLCLLTIDNATVIIFHSLMFSVISLDIHVIDMLGVGLLF